MSGESRRKVFLRDIEVLLKVGIYPHERVAQRVVVNADIEGMFPARVNSLADCFDYDAVHKLVTETWPVQPHVDLLETCVDALLAHIFCSDTRVDMARVSVAKLDIYPDSKCAGVETTWTRADFEKLA